MLKMKCMKTAAEKIIAAAFISFIIFTVYAKDAAAAVISQKIVKVHQLRIYQGDATKEGLAQSYRWGATSVYFGPDDIKKLSSIDIFVDKEGRIETIKVVRKDSSGKLMISIFKNITELSLETLTEGSNLTSQEIPITIRTMDELTIP